MDKLSQHDVVFMFLALGTLLLSARIFGEAARYFSQPAVLGEIIAGVLLGPSVFGRFAPQLHEALFPAHGPGAIVLDGFTTLAIVLFLLVAGLEVDLSRVWKQGRVAVAVSLAGMVFPFALGFGAASAAPGLMGKEPHADPT